MCPGRSTGGLTKKPVHRAIVLEDALLELYEIRCMYADLENGDVFQTFTTKQKVDYSRFGCQAG